MSDKPRDQRAEQAIREFESTALNFAYQAINIAQVRSEYVRRAQGVSAALRSAYQNGEMSAKAAAQAAQALAIALHDEIGMDGDRVNAIFLAMDESYNTDADDVAVLYLQRVFARRGSPLQALTLNRALRATLIRLLDEGWTVREEAALMARVQALG